MSPASGRRAARSRRMAATALAAMLALAVLGSGQAQAARSLDIGLLDFGFDSGAAGVRDGLFDDADSAGAGVVRIHAVWRSIAGSEPADPANPADPAYNFGAVDAVVRDAAERNFRVLLTVTSAPAFAEGPGRLSSAPAGTWKPDPAAFGQFARALATRYSGSFSPGGAAALPRVAYFQAWNEPNLSNHLTPQYENGQPTAGSVYRALLNGFYSGIKAAGNATVVTAGTGPYGDPPGGDRTRPLVFWRDVLCLDRGLGATACPTKASFDVLAHHPINTTGGPNLSAANPNDASTPDFHNVVDLLRAAERAGTVAVGGRHEAWATEVWWESKPPDQCAGVPLKKHGRYLEESFYSLWKQGASLVLWLSVRDQAPANEECGLERLQAGLTFADGSHKPAFRAFRFPFVTDAKGKKLTAWGRAPVAGKVAIQVKDGKRWKTVKRVRVGAGEVFRTKLGEKAGKFRARVGGEKSLVWPQR